MHTAGRGRSPIRNDMADASGSVSKLQERRFRWFGVVEVGLGFSPDKENAGYTLCTSVQRGFALIGGQERTASPLIGYPKPTIFL